MVHSERVDLVTITFSVGELSFVADPLACVANLRPSLKLHQASRQTRGD